MFVYEKKMKKHEILKNLLEIFTGNHLCSNGAITALRALHGFKNYTVPCELGMVQHDE